MESTEKGAGTASAGTAGPSGGEDRLPDRRRPVNEVRESPYSVAQPRTKVSDMPIIHEVATMTAQGQVTHVWEAI